MIHLTEAIIGINNKPRRIGKKQVKYKYHPSTKDELIDAIKAEIEIQGDEADLNCIDTSEITDMSWVFSSSDFDGDISGWDTSNVKNMKYMFYGSKFRQDISGWDTSKVITMDNMFRGSKLDGNEPTWYKK